ncbi:MAG TPA: tRNA-dihydrouridine synthase family protein, partial [Acidobacteriota bacterium]|nr:tRNA-dihydrouridine synthase family protein [Acidobacteriota bacterium]
MTYSLHPHANRISFDQFVYMVAPLEENSDAAFRTICYRHGADLTFTEMTRVQGLVKRNKSTWSRLKVFDETPYVIQLLAGREQDVEAFLKEFKPPEKGFYGFNLNMGCPSPQVIKLGLGSAFMKRVAKAQRLIEIFQRHGYPVSLKIRLGLNAYEKERKSYLNIIKNTTPDFFIVHARHGGQKYKEPADFSVYEEIVTEANGKIIVANGDIMSKEKVDYLKSIGVRGAMIGRGAVWNPAIFDKFKKNLADNK